MKFISLLTSLALLLPLKSQLVYQGGEGVGAGKHIVFIASDHEYRAEQSCPALARILAKHHGFKCTVLFGLNEEGYIHPGISNIPHMETLKEADALVMFTRFLDLPDEQMKHLADYLDSAKPVVGLRTSSHAFKIPAGKTYSRFDFQYKGEDFEKGFGHQILGNTWVGHYGKNHSQGTRHYLVKEQKEHPILRGVKEGAFNFAGGYMGIPADDFTVLTNTQPLQSMDPESDPDPKKPMVPSTWTRHYDNAEGKKARVFHSTQGASEDLLDDNYRRMMINGIFWVNGLEDSIKADNEVSFVGGYNPTTFHFNGKALNVKPSDLEGYESPVVPADAGYARKKKAKKD